MEKNSLASKTMHGIIWKFLERFCAQGISFLVSIVLARLLLPEDFGNVAMILIFITIADVFVNSGFSTALIQKKDADDLDYSTMFYSSQITSVIIYFIIFLLAPLVGKFYNNDFLILLLRVFALRIPISVYNSIQHAYVSNKMLFKKFFFSTLIGTIISGVVGIIMAYNGYGVWSLIAQYFINTIIDTLILSITIPWRPKLIFSLDRAKKLMSFGSKVLLADLSGTVFDQLRGLLIGKKYTSADLAFYEKGNQFPGFISSNVITSIMMVLFPALSKISDDVKKIKNATRTAIQVLSFVMYPLLFGLIICSNTIVIVLLTEKWIDSAYYIRILSLSTLIGLISNVSLQTIKAIGRSDVLLKLEFFKKPIYLLLLILGISISVKWVAITMVIYSVIGSFINMMALSKHVNYSLIEQMKDIFVPLCGSLLMIAIIYFINLPFSNMVVVLLLQILIGIVVYASFALIVKPNGYIYIKNLLLKRK